jgi:hypothetical protein
MITEPFSAVLYDRLPVLFYNNKLRHYFMSASVTSKSFHDMKKELAAGAKPSLKSSMDRAQSNHSQKSAMSKASKTSRPASSRPQVIQTGLQPTTGNTDRPPADHR